MTSKIKVDNIADQDDNNIINESGDVITVGAAGDTVAVAGNIVKSNALQASDGGNIVSQSGTTITLGASGDTIALSAGASQSGFGRTGTVDWQTSIKTSTFTAASGEGYFVNTTSGGVTVNLPAGSAGAIVSIKDYAQTFDTNNCTISPDGSEKIEGFEQNLTLNTEGLAITLVYGDATKGWQSVNSNEVVNTQNFLTATGGTITISGNCKIHTFTGPGTFTVSQVSATPAENIVSYSVVAGGGGGGKGGGGGGAGGYREVKSPSSPYTASPLDGYPSAPNRVTVSATAYPITVGGGGAGQTSSPTSKGASGNTSTFSTVTSAGGGGAGSHDNVAGSTGGSGGGNGNGSAAQGQPAKAGNTPPVSPPQGQNGGPTNNPNGPPAFGGSGGGGAGGNGGSGTSSNGGAGGAGVTSEITASPVARAGGGGGSVFGGSNQGAGGSGGGGAGGPGSSPGAATAGTANTGGGGGGGGNGSTGNGASGGSGIVIIRYKFQ